MDVDIAPPLEDPALLHRKRRQEHFAAVQRQKEFDSVHTQEHIHPDRCVRVAKSLEGKAGPGKAESPLEPPAGAHAQEHIRLDRRGRFGNSIEGSANATRLAGPKPPLGLKHIKNGVPGHTAPLAEEHHAPEIWRNEW